MVPELIQPAVEIVNAANEREQTRDINCDEIKRNLEHQPGDGEHLQGGRGFSSPARLHLQMLIEEIQNPATGENHGVASDNNDGKPKGKSLVPVAKTQRDNGREEKPLVRDGIEHRAEATPLIPMAGDVTV